MMIEVIVAQFNYSTIATSYVIITAFIVVMLAICGLIFLSFSNNSTKPSVKSSLSSLGWGFLLFSFLVAFSSFVLIPQIAENEIRKAEVVNAASVAETLTSESGYAFLVVNEKQEMDGYLLTDNMVCDEYADDDEAVVLAIDENNVIAEQMLLSFSFDEESNSCSYTLTSSLD